MPSFKTRTRNQLADARRRAGELGQPASLTLDEWRAILVGGERKSCALCGEEPPRGLVLSFSGALTARTALPLCRRCHRLRIQGAADLPGGLAGAPASQPVHLWQDFGAACGNAGPLSTSWTAVTCQACKEVP